MVAIGGIDYGSRAEGGTAPVPPTTAPPLSLLRDGGAEFAPLQGSQLEVEECAASFRQAFPEATVTLLTGAGATKPALAAALNDATFVHFATHGFVAYERIQAKTSVGVDRLPDVRLALAPFSLCGLALSGANRGPDTSGSSPGLLTAEELQHYDLSKCHLAVLSACESALGAWSKGQGFASLHEALHVAGARYVVSTLWPVADDGARRLMVAFYRELWRTPDQPYRALWAAKQACIAEGMPFRDWAAFQLSGT
jgi:CHAT domain-containing protein